jgi:hypothetical protein
LSLKEKKSHTPSGTQGGEVHKQTTGGWTQFAKSNTRHVAMLSPLVKIPSAPSFASVCVALSPLLVLSGEEDKFVDTQGQININLHAGKRRV